MSMEMPLQKGRMEPRKARSGFLREMRKRKALYLMMLPGILFLIIICYLPMLGVIVAFKNYNVVKGFWNSEWIGFKNFEFFFQSQNAFRITYNTIFYNSIFIVVGIALALAFAVMLNEIRSRMVAGFYKSSMFVPYFLSWVVVGYISYAMLNVDYGFFNGLLRVFGVEPISWYSEPGYWRYILAFAGLWKGIGYATVIFLAGIVGIDHSYYEAAQIEGASKLQQIFHITIPLVWPIVIILFLLQLGRVFYADFGLFYNLPRETGALFSTTDVIDTYVFRALRTLGDIGMSSAVGLYQSVVGFILVLTSNWIVRRVNRENAIF